MRTLLARAKKASVGMSEDTLLCLSAPLSLSSPVRALVDSFQSTLTSYYAPPARVADFACISLGQAVRIDQDGGSAISQVKARAAQIETQLVCLRAEACDAAPQPRLFGGFRFAPDATRQSADDPWHAFADASFVLPRWTVFVREHESYVQLVIRPAELSAAERLLEELDRIEHAAQGSSGNPSPVCGGDFVQTEQPSQAEYCAMVSAALAEIHAGVLQKVVPARRLQIDSSALFSLSQTLARLEDSYSDCCRFAICRDGSHMVGATPELLFHKRGQTLRTEALAGTRARRAELDDKQLVHELMSDDKEQREHAHVISAITSELHPHCESDPQVGQTTIRTLRNVHHLCTPISASLRKSTHLLDLVEALHPTPAVGGLPRDRAAQFLSTQEPFSRGLYAAPVGYFDLAGDGAFWVAIRSALICGSRAWLYAGAGVVAGSIAQREWAETNAKCSAMRSALGVTI